MTAARFGTPKEGKVVGEKASARRETPAGRRGLAS